MGSEMQRNGSKVLLCFWQCGHVSEDLHVEEEKTTSEGFRLAEKQQYKTLLMLLYLYCAWNSSWTKEPADSGGEGPSSAPSSSSMGGYDRTNTRMVP